ncbi:hypothetical protein Q7P35_010554 [Cladosporium inversicolor]
MEIVGVALGAAPLAIQALDGVRKGFEIFEQAQLADRQFQHFKICLHMEYARLSKWSVMTGLINAAENDNQALHYDRQLKQNGTLVVAALTQIQLLLKDLRKTELRYDYLIADSPVAGLTAGSHHHSPKKSKDIAEPDAGIVVGEILAAREIVPDKKQHFIKRTWAATMKPVKQPKRFWWAVRDDKKFEKTLAQITELIDFLREMLTQDQIGRLAESTNNLNLMMLQLANDISEVKAVLWAGKTQGSASPRSAAAGDLDGETLVGDAHDHDPAEFWREAARFSIKIAEDGNNFADSCKLKQGDVDAMQYGAVLDGGVRTMATTAEGRQVWIEWRSFTIESAFKRAPSREAVERIERLVSLLQIPGKPHQFSVPRCLGYFQDDSTTRFGLVFEPASTGNQVQPISLLSCFANKKVTLGTKVAIAQQLTQWLMYLHVVNWLHKGLRSAIILFSPENLDSTDLGKPFVTGFEFSRVANKGTTAGPTADDIQRSFYVHPDYLGYKRQFGYLKTYDMYSLGVVLIEIAYWQPISDVYRSTTPITRDSAGRELEPAISDIRKFRQQILGGENEVLRHVSMSMGESYSAATKACLQGMSGLGLHASDAKGEDQADTNRGEKAGEDETEQDADQANVQVAADIQQGFIDNVIDVLKSISV